tara:strand:+ start:2205 stop:3326 length:1122 start_codon:yes stop_codon:yes gene_type:complete
MKNKIYKYDFLIVGAGLIGTIAALALVQKKFKVLVIDKKNDIPKDNRTLAVNANSIDFLKQLGIWNDLKSNPQSIDKIIIKDDINKHPLIFENEHESMGNIIFNKEMYELARRKLHNLKILKTDINLKISELLPNKNFHLDKKNYVFKKIIISIGKNIISNKDHKSIVFDQQHHSYVGFFKHTRDHNNMAYEFFTNEGPLAVLPAPAINKKKSTFIYSSKENVNIDFLQALIKKKVTNSHGKLIFEKSISTFPIIPHLIKKNEKFIYIGDSLKSIHPVAGQGWNLGVKDIQTLCKLLDQYSIEAKNLNSMYYSRRFTESAIYLGFTSVINFLYESKIPLCNKIIKAGFVGLKSSKFVRDVFIKQAMGRANLTD